MVYGPIHIKPILHVCDKLCSLWNTRQSEIHYVKGEKLILCEEGAEFEQRLERLAYSVTRKNEVEALEQGLV